MFDKFVRHQSTEQLQLGCTLQKGTYKFLRLGKLVAPPNVRTVLYALPENGRN